MAVSLEAQLPTFYPLLVRAGRFVDAAPAPRLRRWTYAVVALAVVVVAIVHLTLPGEPIFPFDDSYITLHNARVLLSGHDPNYPGVSALYGTTSLPHVVLVSASLLVLPPPHALLLTQWLAVLAYALGLLRLAFMHRASLLGALAGLVAGLGAGLCVHQLWNGLETGLAMAGMTWALVPLSNTTPRRPVLLGLLLGTLPFIRPELIAFSLPLGAPACYRIARARSLKSALNFAGCVALGALPWLVAYAVATHSLGPATVGTKQAFFSQACAPEAIRRKYAWAALVDFGGEVGPFLCLGALLGLWSAPGRIALGFMLVFCTAYYVRFPGALYHYEQRYLYVFVPLLVYGFTQAFAQRARWLRLGATLVLTGVAVGVLTHDVSVGLRRAKASRYFTDTELRGLARWSEQNLPKGEPIAIHDAGYMAYATDLHLVDVVGLKTPDATEVHRRVTVPSCIARRGDAVLEVIAKHHAKYLILYRHAFELEPGLKQSGWKLEPIGPHPIQGKPYEPWTPRYVVYRVTPPK